MRSRETLCRPSPFTSDKTRERQEFPVAASAAKRYDIAMKTSVSFTNTEMAGNVGILMFVTVQYEVDGIFSE